ncbi:MAG: hypothetical protein EBS01_13465, partial [Verrucomicrobia bacterium]|nr:hypothetical protein [Verrucomicrobiota bacterium]
MKQNSFGGFPADGLCSDSAASVRAQSAVFEHRDLLSGDYWRQIPAFSGVSQEDFHSHTFQQRATVTSVPQLRSTLGGLVSESFFEDLSSGMRNAPM